MEEKRKDRRMSLSAKLLIKNMNDDSVKAEEVEIEQTKEERYICGTIFMGLPEVNAKRIEIYEMIDRINEK